MNGALSRPLGLGFLASHGGSNMQAVIDACREGRLEAEPRVVISNNSRSGALRRADEADIPRYHVSTVTHPGDDARDRAIVDILERHGVDLVVLGGYMKELGPQTIARFRNRIVNVHPALLPKFGGRGFYGIAVHEAVLASGDSVTGPTIHLVDEQIDHGAVLAQSRVAVLKGDTAETLAERGSRGRAQHVRRNAAADSFGRNRPGRGGRRHNLEESGEW